MVKEMYAEYCPNCFKDVDTNTGVCLYCGYDQNRIKKRELAIPPINVLNETYLLGKVLGQGGFGITYLAKDISRDKYVAIKECIPESYTERDGNLDVIPKEGYEDAFEQCKERFREEISALYILKDNQFVVDVVDYFQEHNTLYFVMEYIDGVTLKYLSYAQGGTISYQNALLVLLTVASTLMEVHKLDYIHRDISPENIMISKTGDIQLIDFGACRNFAEEDEEEEETVFIKPGFAPPEQYDNSMSQGPWTDIYALGATFYILVTGLPLEESVNRVEEDHLRLLNDVKPEIPFYISDAIRKSMEVDIQERYSSIEEFLIDIAPATDEVAEIDIVTLNLIKEKQEEAYRGEINSQRENLKVPCVNVHIKDRLIKTMNIPEYEFLCIGRDYSIADIVIEEYSSISREHCIVGFDRSRDRFLVIDKSSNGTYFSNGYRMERYKENYLDPNDYFYIFNQDIKVTLFLE